MLICHAVMLLNFRGTDVELEYDVSKEDNFKF